MTLLEYLKKSRFIKLLTSFIFGMLVGVAILAIALSLLTFFLRQKYQGRVYHNLFLLSQSMAGKSVEGLDEFLTSKEKGWQIRKLVFYWQNNEEKKWEITPAMIDFRIDKPTTINDLMSRGRASRGIEGVLELYRLLIFPLEVKPTYKVNQEKLTAVVSQISQEVNRPAQDALFEFKPSIGSGQGRVVDFQVSKEGIAVEEEEMKSLIILAFSRPAWQQEQIALDLPVKSLLPEVTTDQSNRLGVKELLAEGESFFHDSIPSRVHNIILASSYLHGVVVPPGEIFSFAQKIGTISAQLGYKPAYVIKERKTILEDGGGVCQVSTTMFRAALNAGLPIVERQPHYYRVGFYEQGGYPPGLDATVYPPSPDLKFKNDTPAYILIQTVVDKEKKRLAFQFYGSSDGRKMELAKPIIHSQTAPPEPVYIDEPTLPAGVVKRLDTAHWGAKVSVTRKVFNADGSLKEEKTWWSNYTPWAAVYQRGVGGG
jgi:vancomycin resistance protein YoaR